MLPVMILSFGYLILRQALQLIILPASGERANAVEVLARVGSPLAAAALHGLTHSYTSVLLAVAFACVVAATAIAVGSPHRNR